jgi:ferredoxin, 2Fe-2S
MLFATTPMKFKITIDGFLVKADSKKFPYQKNGKPGSVLDIALGHGLRLNHSCGGSCSCTTCHVYVMEGLEDCQAPSEAEENRLREVYGRSPQSRLACQCVPRGNCNLKIEIP